MSNQTEHTNQVTQKNKKRNKPIIILGAILIALAIVFGIVFVVNQNNQKEVLSTTAQDEVTFTLTIENKTQEGSSPESKKYTVQKNETMQYLGDFLVAENLVTVQESEYGRFITAVNGVSQEGDAYWMIYVDGKLATTGMDQIALVNDAVYELRLETYSG